MKIILHYKLVSINILDNKNQCTKIISLISKFNKILF